MNPIDKKDLDKERCQCGAPAGKEVPCIYKLELYGQEKLCNCCPACRRRCFEEI